MTIINNSTATYEVHGISNEEKQRIMDFLQGAVYSWCKNQPDQWFAVRKLMGGENFHWQGTPLAVLYKKHIEAGKTGEEAQKLAGQECGRLLKKVISNDKRNFETKELELARHYLWIPNPSLEDQ